MPGPAGLAGAVAHAAAVAEAAVDSAAGAEAAVVGGGDQLGIVEVGRLGGGVVEHLQVLLHVGGFLVVADKGFVRGGVELRAAGGPAVAAAFAVLVDFGDLAGNGNLVHPHRLAQPEDEEEGGHHAAGQQQGQQHAGGAVVERDLHAASRDDNGFGFG